MWAALRKYRDTELYIFFSQDTLLSSFLVDGHLLLEISKLFYMTDAARQFPAHHPPTTFITAISFQVTTSGLIFDPPNINFGHCVLNEDTAVKLRITNPSALPQTFGFMDTMQGITIKPNDGFGYILPGKRESSDMKKFSPDIEPSSKKGWKRTQQAYVIAEATCINIAPAIFDLV